MIVQGRDLVHLFGEVKIHQHFLKFSYLLKSMAYIKLWNISAQNVLTLSILKLISKFIWKNIVYLIENLTCFVTIVNWHSTTDLLLTTICKSMLNPAISAQSAPKVSNQNLDWSIIWKFTTMKLTTCAMTVERYFRI